MEDKSLDNFLELIRQVPKQGREFVLPSYAIFTSGFRDFRKGLYHLYFKENLKFWLQLLMG